MRAPGTTRDEVAARPAGKLSLELDVMGLPVRLREVDLDTFFRPRSVAVVGASDSGRKPNTALTRKICQWADVGGATLYLVNPTRQSVDGRHCYHHLSEIPQEIDLVAILVGDPLPVVEQAIAVKAGFAVIFAAGFAEVGGAGIKLQEKLEEMISQSSLHVLGPNTNLNAFEVFRSDLKGRSIALITQSGHQGRPIFQGQEIGIKMSHWAPVGNEVDLEVADFMAYFADQDGVGAVACYVEGFKSGRTLQLAADRAARKGVPVVAVKVGRTEAGSSMAKAHTGHLTGSDAVVSAAFRQFGIIRVDGLDQLLEVSAALARSPAPSQETLQRLRQSKNGRVCVYSISGGTGAHMADLVSAAGMELPMLSSQTQEQLHSWIPPYLRVSNPVDNGGAPSSDWRGRKILDTILADPSVDLLLCPITGALPSMAGNLTKDLVEAAGSTTKPVFVVWGSPVGDEPAYRDTLCNSTVPTFRTFTNAVMAAKAYFDHYRFVDSYTSPFDHPPLKLSPAAKAASELLEKVRPNISPSSAKTRQNGHCLSERYSKELLKAYGIPVSDEIVCTSQREVLQAARSIGYPVVMKISSAGISHKSDLGLVYLDISSEAQAKAAYAALLKGASERAPGIAVDGVLVSEQLLGVETVVGLAHDELFGPVVMVGLGGIFVEILKDVTFRVPPFPAAEAKRMLTELAGVALLDGARGRPRASRPAIVDVIMKVQRIGIELSDQILELDINPLIAGTQKAVAADALVVIKGP